MTATPDVLLTQTEATCWLLYHRSPGMTQAEIAEEMQLNQSSISRLLATADTKVAEMRMLTEVAGGDPDVIDQYLLRLDSLPRKNTATHNA